MCSKLEGIFKHIGLKAWAHAYVVGERSNLKKIPTHTQDHGDA